MSHRRAEAQAAAKKGVIVLITGATHTGKTLLAQRLLERYRIPYLSMDHVKMGLIRAGRTQLTPQDDEQMTGYLWPVIREIVKTAVENEQHLIVEGCYVPAGWERDFSPDYLRDIRFYCLAMTEEYIRAHFDDIKDNACAIERRVDDADLDMSALIAENERYRTDFGGRSGGLLLIDDDYETAIAGILSKIKENDNGTQRQTQLLS